MGLETGLLIGSALLGAGGTAYSASQQKKGQERAAAAAERQQKLSQGQEGTNVNPDQYRRRRPGAAGFDAQQGALMQAPGGGNLLGS